MRVYITRAGDTVDWVAWKYYGTQAAQLVERLLDANRGLAEQGALLPAGIEVKLPEFDLTSKTQGLRLWD